MIADGVRLVSLARRLWLLATAVAVALAACSSDQRGDELVGSASQDLTTDQQRILGFESIGGGSSDWTSTSGSISQSSQHVEGNGSLAIANSGNATITSAPLSSLGQIADKITLDLFLPTVQPNPHWLGTLKIVIDCPSQHGLRGWPSTS